MQQTQCSPFRIILLQFLCLFLVGCGAKAYDLRTKPAQGDIHRSNLRSSVERGQITMQAGNQIAEGTADMVTRLVSEIDFLEVEDGQPQRIKISHLESEERMRMSIGPDGAQENVEQDALIGRSLLFTRDGQQWNRRLVGGEPTPEQQLVIDSYDVPWGDDLVPDRKIHVGDDWVISGDQLAKYSSYDAENISGQMRCHFEQVLDFNGEECALISIQMDLTGKVEQEYSGEVSISGEGYVYRSLTSKVDLATRIAGQVTFRAESMADGQRVSMTIRGPIVIEETITKD